MRTIPDPQYYPSPLEFTILVLMVVELIAAGYLARRYYERRGESLPPTLALSLWGLLVGSFCFVLFIFYLSAPDPVYIDDIFLRAETEVPVDPRLRLLLWSFFIWLIPMGYYINLLRHSFSTYAVDHIGPLSGAIEDPSEFADARRMALRGDVNGAVAKYRGYDHNKSEALFEAARLLKSEDRFDEAAAMFEEIMRNNPGNRRAWAEACYQLAKVHELGMGDHKEAKRLLRHLLQRTPETRFGELATMDLARLERMDDNPDEVVPGDVRPPEDDPFFDESDVRVKPQEAPRRKAKVDPADYSPPSVDPFFAGKHLEHIAKAVISRGVTLEEPLRAPTKAKRPAAPAKAKAATNAKPLPKKPAANKPAAAKAKPAAKAPANALTAKAVAKKKPAPKRKPAS